MAAMAADFSGLYGRKIPQSPPPYIGPHLYTVWNGPEPDRIAAIWIMQRFVDRDAVFRFIEPLDKVKFGTPFDMPEAGLRRSGTQSATQVLLRERRLRDAKLDELRRVTELAEVTPWLLVSKPDAAGLAERLRQTATSNCGRSLTSACLPALIQNLDVWYGGRAPSR
jgi:hypothetical protein